MGSREKLLIVEDDPSVLELLERKLKQEGYDCQGIRDPLKAIEKVKHGDITLVITDIRMPIMDGLALTKRLKAIDTDIAIIVITAVVDVESAVKAMKLGADDYITKPFNLDEVTINIQRALEKQRLIKENKDYQHTLEARIKESTKELKEANTKLIETQKYLENLIAYHEKLIESMVDAIIITSKDGRITFASKSAQEMFDYSEEELRGSEGFKFLYGDGKKAEKFLSILKKEGKITSYEADFYAKDGRLIPVSISASLLKDAKGQTSGILSILKDITEHKKLEQELKELSIRDDLTKLYNQRYFYQKLQEEMTRAVRLDQPLFLLLFDIDGFKNYNDRWGHLEGDKVLERVGQVVRDCTRVYVDYGFRYGGDEFTVILSSTTQRQALLIAERIKEAINHLSIKGLSVSIGVVEYEKYMDAKTLTSLADKSMYCAKRQGGGKVCLHEEKAVKEHTS